MMQVFVASDVLLRSRYDAGPKDALEKENISATPANDRQLTFVTNLDWLQPDFVADQIAGIRGSGGSADAGAARQRARHRVARRRRAHARRPRHGASCTQDTAFDVQVVNQGESTETDVVVTVTVGSGGDAIKPEETIHEIAAGEAKNVTIPLSEQPPTGQNVADHGEREAGAGRGGHGQQRGRLHGHLHPLIA